MNKEQLKQIIMPNLSQVWICLSVSLITFLLVFRDLIFSKFFGSAASHTLEQVEPYLQDSYSIQLGNLSQLAATDLIVKAVFFAGIGLIAYVIFLAISNVFIEARNEVVIEAEYTNKGQAQRRARRPILQIIIAVGLFIFLLVSAQLLLPIWLDLFQYFLLNLPAIAAFGSLAISLAGLAVNIYAVWCIGQVVFAVD